VLEKPLVLIYESDPRFGVFNFGEERERAPDDLKVGVRTCAHPYPTDVDTLHSCDPLLHCTALRCLHDAYALKDLLDTHEALPFRRRGYGDA
jgi:hypothetical protein